MTGVKPTGDPHLGNYFGAIKPAIDLINANKGKGYIFIADVHALNAQKDPKFIRDKTYEVAAAWLACGLDAGKTVFYRQSDVPEVFELSSLLTNFTPKGSMNRAHAYKAIIEKDGSDDNVNMGLYTYPILMAADILIMNTDVVPVGLDQKQHIEIARDIAKAFNSVYKKDVLKLPAEHIQYTDSIVGFDGRKMSKSYGNTMGIFASSEDMEKKVIKIPTDSKTPAEPKDKESVIYGLMATFGVDKDYLRKFLAGGIGYGEAKKILAGQIDGYFAPMREKYKALITDRKGLDLTLATGAVLARKTAAATLKAVRETLGLTYLHGSS